MKKVLYTITMVAALALTSCGGSTESSNNTETAQPETVAVDTVSKSIALEASEIVWSGTMIGIYTHTGNMDFTEGQVILAGDKVIGGNFTADLTTMQPIDSNYTEEHTPEMLVGHLSSADFFAVEEFPTASFVITGTTEEGVVGELTIRGITHEENVTISSVRDNEIAGELIFDRQKYDVAWSSGAKDRVLSDDIRLEILLGLK